MTMPRAPRPSLALAALAVTVGLSAPAAAADIEAGAALARRWCADCHVVGPGQAAGRADGVPAFQAIADARTTSADGLRGLLSGPHGRMPDLSLTRREQDDLIAYILGLRAR